MTTEPPAAQNASVERTYLLTPDSVVYLDPRTFKTHALRQGSHVNYAAIRECVEAGEFDKIPDLLDVGKTVEEKSFGKITVRNGVVYYRYASGEEEPVHGTIALRIVGAIREGHDTSQMINFLEKKMLNPSFRAVRELYDFLEASSIPIHPDGDILAYKRVGRDYMSLFRNGTAKVFDNHVGQRVSMPRNRVDEDKDRTCSHGLHFCSFSYLPHYGFGNRQDRVVIVKINPKDVVAIPSDYNNAKGRCCEYVVVGEHTGPDTEDILSRQVVWHDEDIEETMAPLSDFEEGKAAGLRDGERKGHNDADANEDRNPNVHLDDPEDETERQQGYRAGFLEAYYKAYDAYGEEDEAEEILPDDAGLSHAESSEEPGAAVSGTEPSTMTGDESGAPLELPPEPAPKQLYIRNAESGRFERVTPETPQETQRYERDADTGRFKPVQHEPGGA